MSPEAEIKLLQDVAVIKDKVSGLDKSVNGNGKPGLCDRVTTVENSVNDHLKEHKKEQDEEKDEEKGKTENSFRIKLLVIGASLTLLVNIVVTIFNWFK